MDVSGFTPQQKRWLIALAITCLPAPFPPSGAMVARSVDIIIDIMAKWEKLEAERLRKMFCEFEDCDQSPVEGGSLCQVHGEAKV